MGFQDRDYYRDSGGTTNPILWLFSGTFPLFTLFGVRIRGHASLILLFGFVLLLGLGDGYTFRDRLIALGFLAVIILLHELGHVFGARVVGGQADEILLSPLGGLAFTMAPRRPFPTFVTVAAGPAVNVVLMAGAAIALYAMGGHPSWNPFGFGGDYLAAWANPYYPYVAWFFQLNYVLLLLNLLPIYPLDGGQMLQSILWAPMGWYRSMIATMNVAMIVGLPIVAFSLVGHHMWTLVIVANCVINAFRQKAQLKAAGPWAFQDEEEDYSAAYWKPSPTESQASRKAEERAERDAAREASTEAAEQEKIDRILEKVHQKGMASLNFMEKRTLRLATERQRQRNVHGRH